MRLFFNSFLIALAMIGSSVLFVGSLAFTAIALVQRHHQQPRTQQHQRNNQLRVAPSDESENADLVDRSNLDKFLSTKYPGFYYLLSKNEKVLKILQSNDPITVFAPNAAAFEKLGEKKLKQLEDPRNLETAEKMGEYHIIPSEAVSATRLFQEDWTIPKDKETGKPSLSFAGIVTVGGEVAVSRSKSGGFLGLFKEEDGGVIIGTDAQIVQSFTDTGVDTRWVVHETDDLVSPPVLWRYCDQLRIPGF